MLDEGQELSIQRLRTVERVVFEGMERYKKNIQEHKGEQKMKKSKLIQLIFGFVVCGMSGFVISQGFIYISAFKFIMGMLLLAAGLFFVVKGSYVE